MKKEGLTQKEHEEEHNQLRKMFLENRKKYMYLKDYDDDQCKKIRTQQREQC